MDSDNIKTHLNKTNSTGLKQEFSEEIIDIYEKEASIRSKNAEKFGRGINSTPTMRNG